MNGSVLISRGFQNTVTGNRVHESGLEEDLVMNLLAVYAEFCFDLLDLVLFQVL